MWISFVSQAGVWDSRVLDHLPSVIPTLLGSWKNAREVTKNIKKGKRLSRVGHGPDGTIRFGPYTYIRCHGCHEALGIKDWEKSQGDEPQTAMPRIPRWLPLPEFPGCSCEYKWVWLLCSGVLLSTKSLLFSLSTVDFSSVCVIFRFVIRCFLNSLFLSVPEI